MHTQGLMTTGDQPVRLSRVPHALYITLASACKVKTVVVFCLVTSCDATNRIPFGDTKELLNRMEMN